MFQNKIPLGINQNPLIKNLYEIKSDYISNDFVSYMITESSDEMITEFDDKMIPE